MVVNLEAIAAGVRRQVQQALDLHRYQHAITLADKLVSFSSGATDDVFLLATAYSLAGQHKRCLHLLKYHHLVNYHCSTALRPRSVSLADRGPIKYVYLAAHCLEECSEWHECLQLLGDGEGAVGADARNGAEFYFNDDGAGEYAAYIYFIRGHCLEMIDQKAGAVYCYRKALQIDPSCTEAFDRLTESHLLDSQQEAELLQTLQFPPEQEWLGLLYQCKVSSLSFNRDRDGRRELHLLEEEYHMQDNAQLKLLRAQTEFNFHNFRKAVAITSRIVHEEDPFLEQCLLLHISLLLELNLKTDLYSLANSLIEARPDAVVSWFCVGCYYYAMGNYEKAGKFFGKATTMDMRFVPAWVAYGHTFSNVEESDQAMAAYRNAIRLNPGSHLGQLFIGMEHIHSGNLLLAFQFITQSQHVCPYDPLVYNELGVVAYKMKRYEEALQYFLQAIQASPSSLDSNEHWEFPVFNYANTLRKLRRYPEALQYYSKALSLAPNKYSTYSAIGFTYHLMGQPNEAIEYYHRALGLKSNDTFSMQMLDKALEEAFQETIGTMATGSSDFLTLPPNQSLAEDGSPSFSLSLGSAGSHGDPSPCLSLEMGLEAMSPIPTPHGQIHLASARSFQPTPPPSFILQGPTSFSPYSRATSSVTNPSSQVSGTMAYISPFPPPSTPSPFAGQTEPHHPHLHPGSMSHMAPPPPRAHRDRSHLGSGGDEEMADANDARWARLSFSAAGPSP